ncbi:hypothetical protein B7486_40835 [cyanobacterium TDX16]|nr:hypothetical protein B7486_40835 [cyanobacterium TDX16]
MSLVFNAIASVAIAAIAFGQRLPLNSAPLPSTQEKTAAKTYLNIARSIFKNSKKPVSTDAETLYQRGLVKAKQGDYEGAVADFTEAIRLKPKYPEAYYQRALTRYQPDEDGEYENSDSEGAIQDLTQAIQLKPDYADAYYERGEILSNSGEVEPAIEDLNQTIRLNPNHIAAYYSRANLRESELQDKKGALADFDRVLQQKC